MNVKTNMSIYKANQVDSLAVPFAPTMKEMCLALVITDISTSYLQMIKYLFLKSKVTHYLGSEMVNDISINHLINDFSIFDIGDQTEKICELL